MILGGDTIRYDWKTLFDMGKNFFWFEFRPLDKICVSFGYFPHFLPHETKIESMGHFFTRVGEMEHLALHQREKNFSCPQALIFEFWEQISPRKGTHSFSTLNFWPKSTEKEIEK